MIKIKAINIDEVTKEEQLSKFVEEVYEFCMAAENDDIPNLKEEYCDILTAGAGVLKKFGVASEEIDRYYNEEHMNKLRSRNFKPRDKNK